MSTTNTDYSWFWYVRKKGKNWVLGLVDSNGDPIATADLDINYWYDEIPDEITSDNNELPIPRECEHGFMMGVVFEIMRMLGKGTATQVRTYQQDFERAIYDAIHRQVDETQQPLQIAPVDMRMDQQRIRTKTRDA